MARLSNEKGASSPQPENPPIWHQPVIPGMEEFLAKLNQQPQTLPPSQSK